MKTRKAICKRLLEPYYMHRFVDDPTGSRKLVAANQSLNKRKGEIIDYGKKAMGGMTPSGSMSSIAASPCSPEKGPSAPHTPPKKARYR